MAEDELPWQTAFWCVVAVALNTMSQPAGRTLGLSSKYSFYIRSSPVVCLGDIYYTTLQVWSATKSYPSFTEGLAAWKDLRFEDEGAASEDAFDSFRKTTVARVVSFVMGALLPALKIYACTGIPWTQTVCSIYLSCFLLGEALLMACALTRPTRQFRSYPGGRVPYLSRYTATTWRILAFDCSLLSTVLVQVAIGSATMIMFTDAFFLLCAVGPLILAFLTGSLATDEPDTRVPCLLLSICIGPSLWFWTRLIVKDIFLATLAGRTTSDVEFWIVLPLIFFGQLAVSGAAAMLAYVGIGFWSKLLATSDIIAAVAAKFRLRHKLFSARSHAACWLLACTLLYARLYDSESTHDPHWLRIFG